MIIQSILLIQNYIEIHNHSFIPINFQLVQRYPPIQNILIRLYLPDQDEQYQPQQLYILLKQFINKQQQTLGPKRFCLLIQNIFTILTTYIINKLRQKDMQIQAIVFHLNSYKKVCAKYIDYFYQCCILILYILTNFKMNQIQAIDQKTNQCRNIAKLLIKQKDKQTEANTILRICNLFQQYCNFKQNNFKKSKDLCSKIIGMASISYTQAIKSYKQPLNIVKLQLIFCTLTVSKIYKQLKSYQLYSYMLTKCVQYSQKFLQDNTQFIKILNLDKIQIKQNKIKLTRLQQKIRRIQLIEQEQIKKRQHKIKQNLKLKQKNKNNCGYQQSDIFRNIINESRQLNRKNISFSLMKNQKSRSSYQLGISTINMKSRISKISENNHKKTAIATPSLSSYQQSQLKDILVFKDKKKNYYKLKQQTLKYLNKQNNQLKRIIITKDKQIKQIKRTAIEIDKKYNVNGLNKVISKFQSQQQKIIQEIKNKKWNHIKTLPVIKKINYYFKAFIERIHYHRAKNLYQLLYGDTINQSQIKLFACLRKRIHRKQKQIIKKFIYNNIKHQIQFIKQNRQNQKIYYFNIYQYQRGLNGINIQINVSQKQYQELKNKIFCHYYHYKNGKLLKLEQHIQSLSVKSLYFFKKFVNIMNRLNPAIDKKIYKKISINFNYNKNEEKQSNSLINYNNKNNSPIFFIFLIIIQEKKSIKQQYNSKSIKKLLNKNQIKQKQIIVEKIYSKKYFNSHYNFRFLKKFNNLNDQIIDQSMINNMLIQKMNQIWSNQIQIIIKIQNNMRKYLALKEKNAAKYKNIIKTYFVNDFLYTLKISFQTNQKTFFIENLKTNLIHIEKDVNFKDLDFIKKIQKRLQNAYILDQQYQIIQKFLKVKQFSAKIFSKSKHIRFFTDFQTQFKKKLCFSIIKNQFMFRGKMRQGKIMFMLTVKQFSKIPRPYLLRVFTIDQNSMITVDSQKTIYNKQKLFFQNNLNKINEYIQIQSRKQFEILLKSKAQHVKKLSSRISVLSNYSFQSNGLESNKEITHDKSRSNNIKGRKSIQNSIFSRIRHKALIRNNQVDAIQKLIEKKSSFRDASDNSSVQSKSNSSSRSNSLRDTKKNQ